MTQLFRRYDVDEETPVQFVGVYVMRWQPEWGSPTVVFAEVDDPVYDAAPDLLAVCEALLLYYENGIGCDYSEGFLSETDYAEAIRILTVAKATIAKAKGETIDE